MKHSCVRQLAADTIYDEILLTYALLFTRDDKSKQIADRLFGEHGFELLITELKGGENGKNIVTTNVRGKEIIPTDGKVVIPSWSLFYRGQVPMYTHFNHFRGHFAVLKKQMGEWKPTSVGELFQAGYQDRFSWYVTWITISFGVLGVIAVITSIMQAYWSYKGTALAQESLSMQTASTGQSTS